MKGIQLGVFLVIKRAVLGVCMVDYPLNGVYVGHKGMPSSYNMELIFYYVHEGRLAMMDVGEVIIFKNGINPRPF